MRTVLHLCLALPVLLAAPRIVPQGVRDLSFPALRDGQPTVVECRSFHYRKADPWGSIYTHEVLLFRDPVTSAFLGLSTQVQEPYRPDSGAAATTSISIDSGQMRAFTYFHWLQIRLAKKKASSLDAVQQTYLESLATEPPNGEADLMQVALYTQLPKVFFENEDGRPAARLVALGRQGHCWSLEIRADHGESETRWLSNEYDVTNVEECDKPPKRNPKVRPVPGSARVFPLRVQRENSQTTIDVHYETLDVQFPEGVSRRVHLYLVYDAVTRLCYRTWTVETSKTDRHNPKEQIRSMETYIKLVIIKDRMIWFSSVPSGLRASESRERFSNFGAARSHALAMWEKLRLQMSPSEPWFDVAKGVFPREYFYQCGHDEIGGGQLDGITHVNGLWRLAISGQNGNTALVTLNERLERTAVEYSVPVPSVKVERVLNSGTWLIMRNGQPVEIEYREIVVQHPAFCEDANWQDFRSPPRNSPAKLIPTTFRLLFDPATHLSWAQNLDHQTIVVGEQPPTFEESAQNGATAGRQALFAFYETADQIAGFSLAGSQLLVRPSANRHDNWGQFEQDLFERIWSNGSYRVGNPRSIDLKANLTELGQSRPQVLKVEDTADGWLVTITAPNGQAAKVELTHEFKIKGTGVSR